MPKPTPASTIRRLSRLADSGGTLHPVATRRLFPGRPELHTWMPVRAALWALWPDLTSDEVDAAFVAAWS